MCAVMSDSYDLSFPSQGLYATLTKTPSGQWIYDFGTSGILRLTDLGSRNLAGVQRWHLRMASGNSSYTVAKNDLDGRWVNNNEEPVDVTLKPTMWNVLRRLSALEESSYANVNAAITSTQETGNALTQRMTVLEEQRKQQTEYFSSLVNTHHLDCVGAVDTKVAELAGSIRALQEKVSNDIIGKMASADSLTLRVDAQIDQLSVEIGAMKENLHYTIVKKEADEESDAVEQIALLKGTVGSCFLRTEELNQTVDRHSKCITILQRDVGKLSARFTPELVVELSPEFSKSDLEPGEIRCGCKRMRR